MNGGLAKEVMDKGINFLAPYVRPRGNKDEINKLFTYQLEIDSYTCPNENNILKYYSIDEQIVILIK